MKKIRWQCRACGAGSYLAQKLAGKRVQCPKCGEKSLVEYPGNGMTGAGSPNVNVGQVQAQKPAQPVAASPPTMLVSESQTGPANRAASAKPKSAIGNKPDDKKGPVKKQTNKLARPPSGASTGGDQPADLQQPVFVPVENQESQSGEDDEIKTVDVESDEPEVEAVPQRQADRRSQEKQLIEQGLLPPRFIASNEAMVHINDSGNPQPVSRAGDLRVSTGLRIVSDSGETVEIRSGDRANRFIRRMFAILVFAGCILGLIVAFFILRSLQ